MYQVRACFRSGHVSGSGMFQVRACIRFGHVSGGSRTEGRPLQIFCIGDL